jgi:hypothetical protein
MYYVLFKDGWYYGQFKSRVNINNAWHMNKKAIINIYWQIIIDCGYSILRIEPDGNKTEVELTQLAQELSDEEHRITWLPSVGNSFSGHIYVSLDGATWQSER